ncbi:MAG: hypothetical protein RL186_1015, partial [Pseudomonadota bacterium]
MLPTVPVHPRVGGEHATQININAAAHGSSPRGRGTHRRKAHLQAKRRFIPAWAGNTRGRVGGAARMAVHPRVGGEQKKCCNMRRIV